MSGFIVGLVGADSWVNPEQVTVTGAYYLRGSPFPVDGFWSDWQHLALIRLILLLILNAVHRLVWLIGVCMRELVVSVEKCWCNKREAPDADRVYETWRVFSVGNRQSHTRDSRLFGIQRSETLVPGVLTCSNESNDITLAAKVPASMTHAHCACTTLAIYTHDPRRSSQAHG